MTEKEIFNGILNCKNPTDTALYFERRIVGIEQKLKSNLSLSRKFIDLDKDDNIDEPAKVLLDELKNEKIPSKLPKSNIFKFDVMRVLASHYTKY